MFQVSTTKQFFWKFVTLKSVRGDYCCINFNWNSHQISLILTLPFRLELNPFERFVLYKDKIINDNDFPIRSYKPKIIQSGTVFDDIRDFKPGFFEQAKRILICSMEKSKISASLNDAYKASLSLIILHLD